MAIEQALLAFAFIDCADRSRDTAVAVGDALAALFLRGFAERRLTTAVFVRQTADAGALGDVTQRRVVSHAVAVHRAGRFALMVARRTGLARSAICAGRALFALAKNAERRAGAAVRARRALCTSNAVIASHGACVASDGAIGILLKHVVARPRAARGKDCSTRADNAEQKSCLKNGGGSHHVRA
jgi:hypothetical protein